MNSKRTWIGVQDLDRPAIAISVTFQDLYCGGFTGAIWPQDGINLAALNREGDAGNRLVFPIFLAQIEYFYSGAHGFILPYLLMQKPIYEAKICWEYERIEP